MTTTDERLRELASRINVPAARAERPWVWYPGTGQEQHVEYLQRKLAEWGVYDVERGDPVGIFDRHTEAAVRAFQTLRGMRADAVVSPDVWAELEYESSSGE